MKRSVISKLKVTRKQQQKKIFRENKYSRRQVIMNIFVCCFVSFWYIFLLSCPYYRHHLVLLWDFRYTYFFRWFVGQPCLSKKSKRCKMFNEKVVSFWRITQCPVAAAPWTDSALKPQLRACTQTGHDISRRSSAETNFQQRIIYRHR